MTLSCRTVIVLGCILAAAAPAWTADDKAASALYQDLNEISRERVRLLKAHDERKWELEQTFQTELEKINAIQDEQVYMDARRALLMQFQEARESLLKELQSRLAELSARESKLRGRLPEEKVRKMKDDNEKRRKMMEEYHRRANQ